MKYKKKKRNQHKSINHSPQQWRLLVKKHAKEMREVHAVLDKEAKRETKLWCLIYLGILALVLITILLKN